MTLDRLALRLKNFYRERQLFTLLFLGRRLIPDYRFTWYQMEWWSDAEFNTYLEKFGERHRFNSHRRWMLWQLTRLIEAVPGDTAECGVFEGSSSWLICSAIQGHGRVHHLFDSFEGLSEPQPADGDYWTKGALAVGEQAARANLAPFAGMIEFHKGWIPDRFDEVADKTFAFVHIDVDLGQPTLDSLEFFYPRMPAGAVLVCDDYFCTTCRGVTAAVDGFLADKPEKMLPLDAGGGFFIRGTATAPRTGPISSSGSI